MVESKVLFAWHAPWFLNLLWFHIRSVFHYLCVAFQKTCKFCLEVWALRGKGFEGLHTDQSGRHRPEVDHGAQGASRLVDLNEILVNQWTWELGLFTHNVFPVVCWCWYCCVLSRTSKGVRPSSMGARGYADLRSRVRSREKWSQETRDLDIIYELHKLWSFPDPSSNDFTHIHMFTFPNSLVSAVSAVAFSIPPNPGSYGKSWGCLLRSHSVISVISVIGSSYQDELDQFIQRPSLKVSRSSSSSSRITVYESSPLITWHICFHFFLGKNLKS